jgi:hypothetical protein
MVGTLGKLPVINLKEILNTIPLIIMGMMVVGPMFACVIVGVLVFMKITTQ